MEPPGRAAVSGNWLVEVSFVTSGIAKVPVKVPLPMAAEAAETEVLGT